MKRRLHWRLKAKAAAQVKAREVAQRLAERAEATRETGKKTGGKPPVMPDPEMAVPEAKAQKNFTDSESRIMKDGSSKSFEQAYNAQAVVDSVAQIIVATGVTQEANGGRTRGLSVSESDRGTGVWPDQTGKRISPVQLQGQGKCWLRMESDLYDAQSFEGIQIQLGAADGLKGPKGCGIGSFGNKNGPDGI